MSLCDVFWLKTQYVTTIASIAHQWIWRAALHRHNRVALRRAQSVDMVGFLLRLKRACQFSRSAAAAVLRNAIATHLRRSWCSGYHPCPRLSVCDPAGRILSMHGCSLWYHNRTACPWYSILLTIYSANVLLEMLSYVVCDFMMKIVFRVVTGNICFELRRKNSKIGLYVILVTNVIGYININSGWTSLCE